MANDENEIKEEKENTKKKSKKSTIVLNAITNALSIIFVAFSVFIMIVSISSKNNKGVPTFGNKSYLYVTSESMTGTINKGDLIVVDHLNFKYDNETEQIEPSIELKENESIISFFMDINGDGKNEIVTHQLIDIQENGTFYQCKGTYVANEGDVLATQTIHYSKVIGVYAGKRIPYIGSIYAFMFDTPSAWGFAVVVVAPMFIFFCFKAYQLIATIIETKEENAKVRAVEMATITEEEKEKQKAAMRAEILKELGLEENKKESSDDKTKEDKKE